MLYVCMSDTLLLRLGTLDGEYLTKRKSSCIISYVYLGYVPLSTPFVVDVPSTTVLAARQLGIGRLRWPKISLPIICFNKFKNLLLPIRCFWPDFFIFDIPSFILKYSGRFKKYCKKISALPFHFIFRRV